VQLEPSVQCQHMFGTAPPACVSCERPHARLRYCHACGTEIFNVFFECEAEECPFEMCGACGTSHFAAGSGLPMASADCAHAACRPHFLHALPEANAQMLLRARRAIAQLAGNVPLPLDAP
jgi:hypothetical protein